MRDVAERCPNDGSILGYGIDWLGRLAGYCDVCGGRYKRSTIPEKPHIEPELISAATELRRAKRLDEADTAVIAALKAEPEGLSLAELAARVPLTRQRIRLALRHGRAAGEVSQTQRRVTGVRPQTVYYYLPHGKPDTLDTAERVADRVLDLLKTVKHWRRAEDIARTLGVPSGRIHAALGILAKRCEVEHARHMRNGAKVKEWRAC